MNIQKLINKFRPKVEESWILLREYEYRTDEGILLIVRKVMYKRGDPHQVNHDANWMLDRFMEFGDIEGVSHTHPFHGPAHPSGIDVNTAGAWARALGREFLCVIEWNGKPHGWYFENENSRRPVDVYPLDRNAYSIFIGQ